MNQKYETIDDKIYHKMGKNMDGIIKFLGQTNSNQPAKENGHSISKQTTWQIILAVLILTSNILSGIVLGKFFSKKISKLDKTQNENSKNAQISIKDVCDYKSLVAHHQHSINNTK